MISTKALGSKEMYNDDTRHLMSPPERKHNNPRNLNENSSGHSRKSENKSSLGSYRQKVFHGSRLLRPMSAISLPQGSAGHDVHHQPIETSANYASNYSSGYHQDRISGVPDDMMYGNYQWEYENRLVRNDFKRKSTLKSIRKLIRRYLGLKEGMKSLDNQRRYYIEGPSTSHSISEGSLGHMLTRSQSTSSHIDKTSQTEGSANKDTNRQYSVRSRSAHRSYSRTSLSGNSVSGRHNVAHHTRGRSSVTSDNQESASSGRQQHISSDEVDSGVDLPSEGRQSFDLSTPCLKGITNLGNTCYMNSVLQCMSAIEPLAEYFLLDHYINDLKDDDRTLSNGPSNKSSQAVTRAFAAVLKSLWYNNCSDSIVRNFRNIIGRYNSDYRSSLQQDAQELLVWLLDIVNEDLTCSNTHPKCITTDRNDSTVLERRNSKLACTTSIINTLFGAEFRSSIRCRACAYTKLNFDPYMFISLQVPQDTRKPLYVTLTYFESGERRLIRFGINVEYTGRICDVRECISHEAKIPENKLFMYVLTGNGFWPVISDAALVSEFATNELSAVELPTHYTVHHDDVYIVFIIDEVTNDAKRSRIRLTDPFICVIPQYSSYRTVCAAIFGTLLAACGRSEDFEMDLLDGFENGLHQLRVVAESGALSTLYPTSPMPLYAKALQNSISAAKVFDGLTVPVFPVIVECKETYIERNLRPVLQTSSRTYSHQSCEIVDEQLRAGPATLRQCIDEFSSAEYIEWNCENCGMNSAEKIMKFRSLPNILVFHLKRFRQTRDNAMIKLDRAVDFPITGLDMASYVYRSESSSFANRKSIENECSVNGYGIAEQSTQWNGDQNCLYVNTSLLNEYIYDLIAIVHHMGETINSGHYTATTKNALDGKWRHYDDNIVRIVDPVEAARNSTAYLLFYEKRVSRRQFAHPSPGHSSTESGVHEHWFIRACLEKRKNYKNSKNNVPVIQSKNELEGTASSINRNSLKIMSHPVTHRMTAPETRPLLSTENSWTPTVTRRKVTNTEVW